MSLLLSAGSEGISSYGISIQFDVDLADELDLQSAVETLPLGFDINFSPGVDGTQESDASQIGEILTFEAATLAFGPADLSFEIGVIEFLVTSNVATDGVDIEGGLFGFVDGIFDNLGVDLAATTVFNSASVNVPEPATSLLLALGLLAIRLAAPRQILRGK